MALAVQGRMRRCARWLEELLAKNAKDRCECGRNKTNDESIELFGSAGKDTGICLEEKTQLCPDKWIVRHDIASSIMR
jgi:hypothetical protein